MKIPKTYRYLGLLSGLIAGVGEVKPGQEITPADPVQEDAIRARLRHEKKNPNGDFEEVAIAPEAAPALDVGGDAKTEDGAAKAEAEKTAAEPKKAGGQKGGK